jgi:hypothetical protein
MNIILQLVILGIGLSLCIWVIMLLASKKINERNSIIFVGGIILVLILSVNPNLLDVVANWAGVSYPPSLLFLCAFIVLLIITVYQSIQISQLYDKIKEISQSVALHTGQIHLEKLVDEEELKLKIEG